MQFPRFTSKIVPVVVIDQLANAVPLAEALLEGGIDVIEITLRSSVGLAAIHEVRKHVPTMQVGAGTVLSVNDLRNVKQAGAQFALSPGCTQKIYDAVHSLDFPFIPGVVTASEVMMAQENGFDLCKLFPASLVGGVAMLRALHGPLGTMRFCPTGGVKIENIGEFLALPYVPFVGGTWLTPEKHMVHGDWQAIRNLARQATDAVAALA